MVVRSLAGLILETCAQKRALLIGFGSRSSLSLLHPKPMVLHGVFGNCFENSKLKRGSTPHDVNVVLVLLRKHGSPRDWRRVINFNDPNFADSLCFWHPLNSVINDICADC